MGKIATLSIGPFQKSNKKTRIRDSYRDFEPLNFTYIHERKLKTQDYKQRTQGIIISTVKTHFLMTSKELWQQKGKIRKFDI